VVDFGISISDDKRSTDFSNYISFNNLVCVRLKYGKLKFDDHNQDTILLKL